MQCVKFACVFIALAAQAQGAAPVVDEALTAYVSTRDTVHLPDGRSIHIVCMGQGSPTVILTAGLGDWSISWSSVQSGIAKTSRVCAWDRPGFGLTDAASGSSSSATTEANLEAALARGGIAAPYILVSHSMGSFESLLYADRHPAAVAGMVLIDPTVPGQSALLRRVAPLVAESSEAYTGMLVKLVRDCAVQIRQSTPASAAGISPDCQIRFPDDFPPAVRQAVQKQALKPGQAEAVASFYENAALSSEQVVNPRRSYADLPLIVLTATKVQSQPGETSDAAAQNRQFAAEFNLAHDQIAALSSRGINSRVPGTGHYIHQEKPQVVIDAVNQVISAARAGRRSNAAR